jgi:hypothetical protein
VAIAAAFVATALGLGGCSTFQERPGHSSFSASRARNKKKTSLNPLFHLFKREEPKLAQTPSEFVDMPRPAW